jgi:hypothetical protein
MNDTCRPQRVLLAEGPFCKVESCECGTIHVSLGPITLRLRVDVVESVWMTLGEALTQFGRTARRRPAMERERLS